MAVVSLVDLVPQPEVVALGVGREIPVRGLTVEDFAQIFGRFPEIGKLFAQREFNAAALITALPQAMSAIIAAGVGKIGDEAQEQAARSLPLGTQADLLAAVLRLTMPRGVGAFLELLEGFVPGAGAAFDKARATSSSSPSTGSSPAAPIPSESSSA